MTCYELLLYDIFVNTIFSLSFHTDIAEQRGQTLIRCCKKEHLVSVYMHTVLPLIKHFFDISTCMDMTVGLDKGGYPGNIFLISP